MHLEFDETFDLPPAVIYDYFKTPQDWVRLYEAFGDVSDKGDGWYAVPMRRFPFPLVTKMTVTEPGVEAAWDFKGFWNGHGEVHLKAIGSGTQVTGYETATMPRLLGLGPLVEKRLEPLFVALWESGWQRLRDRAQGLK